MKVLLVRPAPSPETIGLQHVMVVEPLELEVLAALRGPGDQVFLADLLVEPRPLSWFLKQHRPDLVAVTGYITNVPAMVRLCRESKQFDARTRTVVGGVHVEVCPEHLDHPAVDFRIVRNATRAFPALLDHLRGQGDVPPGVLVRGQRLDEVELPEFDFYYPKPDRSLTAHQRDHYFYIFHDHVALLKTAFGCPFKCTFCYCRAITDDRYHPRPVDEVLDELQEIREREIYIVDDDFLISVERLTAFLDGLRQRGLDKSFLIYGRADFIARNPAILRRFRSQGLRTVIIGFESFRDQDLDGYNKRTDFSLNVEAMRLCRELGIDVFATIVVPPSWTREDFAFHGTKFKQLGIQYVNLQPLTPLPGTGLHVEDRDLLLAPGDFERWDLAHVAVRPQHLSVAEFYQQLIKLYMVTLYQPRYLRSYLKYPRRMMGKMLAGTWRVRRQYLDKLREAKRFG
ncbi:MAG: radical SAM protein [Pseudomonadota bacterium]